MFDLYVNLTIRVFGYWFTDYKIQDTRYKDSFRLSVYGLRLKKVFSIEYRVKIVYRIPYIV